MNECKPLGAGDIVAEVVNAGTQPFLSVLALAEAEVAGSTPGGGGGCGGGRGLHSSTSQLNLSHVRHLNCMRPHSVSAKGSRQAEK
jgi:hypothetical protein